MKLQIKKKNQLFKRPALLSDFNSYINFLYRYLKSRIYLPFSYFESAKDVMVNSLYRQRGKYSRPILHLGAIATIFAVFFVAPLIFNPSVSNDGGVNKNVLGVASAEEVSFYTMQAEEVRQLRGGEVTIHKVTEGETLSSIADRYGLKKETILWENNLTENSKLKVDQELRILPIDGIRHKVAKGETVVSIGKKYGIKDAAVQAIVDFPFNDFVNNETFELATGQYLMVPGGVKLKATTPTATFAGRLTPSAGAVSATGSFVWPAAGVISQGYSFYHSPASNKKYRQSH